MENFTPVSQNPSMDGEGLKCFSSKLEKATSYLEYGSGGSTVLVSTKQHIKSIISVESDELWTSNVRKSLLHNPANLDLIHVDIGETGEWGVPKNSEKSSNWWRYSVAPWERVRTTGMVPDLILIDGRFRVASFLYSLLCARKGTAILFDDYCDRPHYHVVEEFCKVEETHGRMAVFMTNNSYSMEKLVSAFARYTLIYL